MEIKEITEALKDFRGIIEGAQKETRQYNKTSSNIYKPENARFKLVIWFKDGNTRYFYSYDNKHLNKEVLIDEYEALLKLVRLAHKYEGTYKNAILYATLDPDKKTSSNYNYQMMKFDIYNNKRTNKFVNFINLGKSNILDFKKMHQFGQEKI